MIKTKLNRKGIAPILAVLIILGVLVAIYLFLYIPIPAFTALRYTLNYWGIVIFFFSMQVGIIYLVYKGISYFGKGFKDIQKFVKNWQIKIRNYFIFHFQ